MIRVNTADMSLDGTSKTLFVRLESNRHALDTFESVFTMTFNFVLYSCTPALTEASTMVSLWPDLIMYKIGTDSLVTFDFLAAENGSCMFTSSLFESGTTNAPMSPEFAYTIESLSLATLPD